MTFKDLVKELLIKFGVNIFNHSNINKLVIDVEYGFQEQLLYRHLFYKGHVAYFHTNPHAVEPLYHFKIKLTFVQVTSIT